MVDARGEVRLFSVISNTYITKLNTNKHNLADVLKLCLIHYLPIFSIISTPKTYQTNLLLARVTRLAPSLWALYTSSKL